MSQTFEPDRILEALDRHGVNYVVVGGYAAVLHGSPRPTHDIDITPQMTHVNLTRLIAAMTELDARIRTAGDPEGLPFRTSPEALVGASMLNLVTRYGDFDLTIEPAGIGTYEQIAARATSVNVAGRPTPVAALDDVITSKAHAGRDKDRVALPGLRALQEAIRQAQNSSTPPPAQRVDNTPTTSHDPDYTL